MKLAKNILAMNTIKKNTEKKKEHFHFFRLDHYNSSIKAITLRFQQK